MWAIVTPQRGWRNNAWCDVWNLVKEPWKSSTKNHLCLAWLQRIPDTQNKEIDDTCWLHIHLTQNLIQQPLISFVNIVHLLYLTNCVECSLASLSTTTAQWGPNTITGRLMSLLCFSTTWYAIKCSACGSTDSIDVSETDLLSRTSPLDRDEVRCGLRRCYNATNRYSNATNNNNTYY